MIQLYTWGTPNGKKASIMLEEVGLPYEVHAINIGQNDQFKPEYLAINPNNKIQAIIDTRDFAGERFLFKIRIDNLTDGGGLRRKHQEVSDEAVREDIYERNYLGIFSSFSLRQ